nr:hypothetical protein [Angustibacter aerolatus]
MPTDYDRAGWLETGPVPGARGPAVIAGHVDSRSRPAVFYRLREPADRRRGGRGARRRQEGAVHRRRCATVSQKQVPDGRGLRPVARAGAAPDHLRRRFDRSVGHYRDNVVVYAS